MALRDEAAFRFEQLIDVCGVDYLAYGEAEWATDETTTTGFSRAVDARGSGRLPALDEELRHRTFVEHIIDFLEIQAYRKTPVGRLPYGLQKRVDLGRALAMEPQVLLLDEPMAGMNVEEKEDMCRFILDVNDEFGTTIVLIEHDMGVVMDISDRVVVLDYGRKIGDGTPDEVRANQEVIDAYLGVAH
jgi:branched-chain amino acid transport system ATP-binding protein